jgi:DEAD/DEAH box helicase domain-containing protein
VPADPHELLRRLSDAHPDRLLHVEDVPARTGTAVGWPDWVDPDLRDAWGRQGIALPWAHQADAADLAWRGRHVVVATGTASGKSLAYLMPALTSTIAGTHAANGRGATALYLAPTKALAHDQWRAVAELGLDRVRVAAYDGDTPDEERAWIRAHATYVLSNPDLLHRSMLPGHTAWASFLRRLRYVVVDECHVYRGVFGSHVGNVLRRLRRVAARYGADPVFVLASATSGDPAASASRLVGVDVTAVAEDASPRGATAFALWEPPLTDHGGEHDAPTRRTATAETASLLTDLVVEGVRTLAFVRSRRGVEAVAMTSRAELDEVDPELRDRVAAYRAGYLPEERRELEAALRDGRLLGVAATNALELGVDVTGLDAVLLCGWPGTRASLWQQAGRAGRSGDDALAVLVARDDPLDTYLVHHPEAVFGAGVEATVLRPHEPLRARAAPVRGRGRAAAHRRGPRPVRPHHARGARRPRRARTAAVPAGRLVLDAAGAGERPRGPARHRRRPGARGRGRHGPRAGHGRPGAAHTTVHTGAVYVHQGTTYVVDSLDLADSVAIAHREDVDWTTSARDTTDIRVVDEVRRESWGEAELVHGHVEVTNQVVGSYLKRRYLTGTGARRGAARPAAAPPAHPGRVVDGPPSCSPPRGSTT